MVEITQLWICITKIHEHNRYIKFSRLALIFHSQPVKTKIIPELPKNNLGLCTKLILHQIC